ncbi:MAG: hypothetical protein KHX60_15050 [Subdoligranulum variabile]|nr:hypothetical protein [Subdoligranulum variabile]
MLRTKHLKMAVVPMTLLALLSTAVPVASAQETTDESFYELTTTPSGGDMIVGEPGTTILFDWSWPYRVTYTPVAAGPWMRIATADGSGVDGVSVTRW